MCIHRGVKLGLRVAAIFRQESTMYRDTFDSTMRVFKNRHPFRPFTVAMSNGDRLEVDHPDALAVRDGVALFAAPGGIPVVFDFDGVSQVVGDLADRPGM
jgi:hypothetical protein